MEHYFFKITSNDIFTNIAHTQRYLPVIKINLLFIAIKIFQRLSLEAFPVVTTLTVSLWE